MVIVCVLAWMTTHTHFVKNRRELTMNVPREEGLDFGVVVNNASMVNGSVVCPRDSQCHFFVRYPRLLCGRRRQSKNADGKIHCDR